MKNLIVTLLAIGLFVLVGCGASAPPKKEMADRVEDIVGTWQRVGGVAGSYFIQYREDGTYKGCVEKIEQLEGELGCRGEYWFEGGKYYDKMEWCEEIGIYEIRLQPNGNLKFEMIEDKCRHFRANDRQGRVSAGEEVEYERVP